jgi:hypothetical protein
MSSFIGQDTNCKVSTLFARSGTTIVGVYVGAEIQKGSIVSAIEKFAEAIASGTGERNAVQLCGGKRVSSKVFGIYSDSRGNITAVQEALRTWNDGACLSGFDKENTLAQVEFALIPALDIPLPIYEVSHEKLPSMTPATKFGNTTSIGNSTTANSTFIERRTLAPREECRAIQAVANDGCWALADRCKISQGDLEKYNTAQGLSCEKNNVVKGQYYCCSQGSPPDFSPKPNADGTCVVHVTDGKKLCWEIANDYMLSSPEKIDEYNKNTWGWRGCAFLSPKGGEPICVSSGKPPMPVINPDATCGPQKPGTVRPTDGTPLEKLNPCPLNACCSNWGFCGTTDEFCALPKSKDGAPGSQNGCMSNCGTDIVNNKEGPAQFAKIGYFEGWNGERACGNMDAGQIGNDYTHVHFAFGEVTRDFRVDVSQVQDQFDAFLGIQGPKRILSFGGWAFSAEVAVGKWDIFRQAVLPGNREKLAQNVVDFVKSSGLDGVDFDWEYPSAPDLPDIPTDSKDSGALYLEFLKLVRKGLPAGKTLAIAAPASYWYLSGFPIAEIAKVVDYIVYMTYDFHGQWDYANKWSV